MVKCAAGWWLSEDGGWGAVGGARQLRWPNALSASRLGSHPWRFCAAFDRV